MLINQNLRKCFSRISKLWHLRTFCNLRKSPQLTFLSDNQIIGVFENLRKCFQPVSKKIDYAWRRFFVRRLINNFRKTVHANRIIYNRIFSFFNFFFQCPLYFHILAFGKHTFKYAEINSYSVFFQHFHDPPPPIIVGNIVSNHAKYPLRPAHTTTLQYKVCKSCFHLRWTPLFPALACG